MEYFVMSRVLTPQIGRRQMVSALAATAASTLIPPELAAQIQRVATPASTEGPFYPVEWSGDIDNDLVVVQGEAARALGQITHVIGRVLDRSGNPVARATIEIWQCDANGHYRHPDDRQSGRDPGFQGRGRTLSEPDGRYAFRTIRPVAYPGRTPHIHFAVIAPQRRRLVTQMYVAGESQNARDGVLNQIRDRRQRESVIVRLEPAERLEAGALTGTFDIVLG
jgi:protocatechuate 3,4-dioxygenase, beta subunit